jgi:hypothetical protein
MKNFTSCALLVLRAAAICVGAAAASAQTMPETRRVELPVTVPVIRNFHVTSLGRVLDDGSAYSSRACNQVSTWTDANFNGGSYRAQAGFAQGEMFAATYTVPATDWPIKFNLAEMIFATSNATISTTTQWSILFWQGNPQTGTLVFSETADDVILPYIRMGPGTNGVNVQFSIDSSDPDQLILNDNGTHQFTVAWRIDHHQQQTADPCFTAPPSCCNAFPVTDVSGLARPADNWLYGVNCGSLGCPANGGWSRFSQLASYCRPTGDIVTRVTWSSLDCQPGTGACCLPDGTCQVLAEADCGTAGGLYRGEFTSCSTANCPTPTGACCLGNGNCLVLSPANCTVVGGSYLGNGSVCGAGNTCPLGACCLPNGSCGGSMSEAACIAAGGQFRGVGTTCATSTCPTGGCCLPDGSCAIMTQIQCTSRSGTWRGAGTTCVGANCPQPTGACCLAGGCLVLTSANCALIPGSSWAGAFTTCADLNGNGIADVCDAAAPCPADYNQDGGVDGADVQAFFIDWAAGYADVNQDGGVDGADVQSFFIVWQAGGC